MGKGTKFIISIILAVIYLISLWGILSDSPIGAKYMFATLAFIAICVTVYLLWPNKKKSAKVIKIETPTTDYIVESFSFKVKGVTFSNGNKSRQAILCL